MLEQGGLTAHWPGIIAAVEESIPTITAWELADVAKKLRDRSLCVCALWLGESVQGYVVMAPVTMGDHRGMNIYALAGKSITLDQWRDLIAQLADILRTAGVSRIVALTDNQRVLDIVRADGWLLRTYCERVV